MQFFRRPSNRDLLHKINKRTKRMGKELDDLNGAVAVIGIAVGDASSALKDIAAKLAAQSSTNPGDVEAAANKLLSIAKGLDDVVTAAGEPITTAGNDTVSAAAGNDTVSGGTGEQPIDPATDTASQSAVEQPFVPVTEAAATSEQPAHNAVEEGAIQNT